jgi:mRNA-degrading endonuclease RelE of RelBE toxin-antitoxin system
MVRVAYEPAFERKLLRIRDAGLRRRVGKQILKLIARPELGKPMRFGRRGTREVRMPPFRLSYLYLKDEGTVVLLDLCHKDEQ